MHRQCLPIDQNLVYLGDICLDFHVGFIGFCATSSDHDSVTMQWWRTTCGVPSLDFKFRKVSDIDHFSANLRAHACSITAPLRHLPVTESTALPPWPKGGMQ